MNLCQDSLPGFSMAGEAEMVVPLYCQTQLDTGKDGEDALLSFVASLWIGKSFVLYSLSFKFLCVLCKVLGQSCLSRRSRHRPSRLTNGLEASDGRWSCDGWFVFYVKLLPMVTNRGTQAMSYINENRKMYGGCPPQRRLAP